MLQRDWVVEIKHTLREANRAAYHLALTGHATQLGVCFYESMPTSLASFLRDDAVGVSFSRMIV